MLRRVFCNLSLFSTIVLCLFLGNSVSAQKYMAERTINHSICVNTHLGYRVFDYAYREDICKSLGEMHFGMVRDYVYINSNNTFDPNNDSDKENNRALIFNNILYNLHKYAPNTQVLGVLHDLKWDIDKDVSLSVFYDLVRKAVKTYDGKTRFVPTDYGKEMSFEIKYWEICNEFDIDGYGKLPFENIKDAFNFVKTAYYTIKEANPDAMVVFPGVADVNSRFVKDIFEYVDEDGNRIWNFFDVFNFHYYPASPEELIPMINIVNECKHRYGWDQPIWLTEVGWTEFYSDEEEIAKDLPEMFFIAFACGIDKVFYFQYRQFCFNTSVDASFGLLRSSLDASYISLSCEGGNFSLRPAYKNILINSNRLKIPLNHLTNKHIESYQLKKIKDTGLDIVLYSCNIENIRILHDKSNKDVKMNCIEVEGRETIRISPSAFENCSINDTIIISFKNYKRNIKWKKADKTISYYSLSELFKQIPDGSYNFTLAMKDDTYICGWIDDKGIPRKAIWCHSQKDIKIDTPQKLKAKNYLGERTRIPKGIVKHNNGILYIKGDYNFSIQ